MKWWTVRVVFLLAMIFCLFFLVGKDSEKDVQEDIYKISEKISDFYFLNGKSLSKLKSFLNLEGYEKNGDGTPVLLSFSNKKGAYMLIPVPDSTIVVRGKGYKWFSSVLYYKISAKKENFLCVYPEGMSEKTVDCLVKQQSDCDEGYKGYFYGKDQKVFVIEKR
jgi:hypothetical protein